MVSEIKQREIVFAAPHPDANQARSAMLLLHEIPVIQHTTLISPTRLIVGYYVEDITLEQIHEALSSIGFHLDNNLLTRLKNALYYYVEETERVNRGVKSIKSTGHLFANTYKQLPHGCRDERPEHWRKYL